ncbi:MAG: glutaredoxin [Patescibacteria group bacterium]
MKKILLVFLFLFFLPIFSSQAEEKNTEVIIFTQTGCQHCAKALALLDNLQNQYPNIKIVEYDLRKNPEYYQKFLQFSLTYNVSTEVTPITFIDNKAISGYDETTISTTIERCNLSISNCQSPQKLVDKYLADHPEQKNLTTIEPAITTDNNKTLHYVFAAIIIIGGIGLLINRLF